MKRTSRKYSRVLNLIIALLWVITPTLPGQTTIQGVILYPDGAEAIGAEVILVGTSVHTNTDTSGFYEIKTDMAGPYTIEVRHMTYKTVSRIFECCTSSTWDIILEESSYLLNTLVLRTRQITLSKISSS